LNLNFLTGPIPAELNELVTLRELYLESNGLVGPLPNVAALTGLEILSLAGNVLDSTVGTEYNALTALKELNLNGTGLTGPFPAELLSLPSIQVLILDDNLFSGSLPATGWEVSPNLTEFRLSRNNITGTIPVEIATALSLGRSTHVSMARTLFKHDDD
jgi:Leucine-rich repeat (LRR) protein